MNKNNFEIQVVASCNIIRSSKEKKALIGWSKRKLDESSGRWYERLSATFENWDDCYDAIDEFGMEMEDFRTKRSSMSVRESWVQTENCTDGFAFEKIYITLNEFAGTLTRSIDIEVEHAYGNEIWEWEDVIWEWHQTGELRTGPLEYSYMDDWKADK